MFILIDKMKVRPMIDATDSFTIQKKEISNLPTRTLMIASSGYGKSSLLGWLMCNCGEEGYGKDFKPDNIYIISGSLKGDFKLKKMIDFLEIPEDNLFDNYDNDVLNELYDNLVDDFNEKISNGEKADHTLIVMDDLGFSNKLNKVKMEDNALERISCNGRKYLVSSIVLNQRIIQCSPTVISQASNIILWKPNNKDLELYESNFNYLDSKKTFNKMVRDNTKSKHNFMSIDFSKDNIYRDQEFKPIEFD